MEQLREAAASVKCLIFDLDGTIADTIGTIRDAVNLCMEHRGYPTHSYEEVRLGIGSGSRELIRKMLPAEVATEEHIDTVHEEYLACYEQTYINCKECYAGMAESICKLNERGYTVAVLSNKVDKYVKAMLPNLLPEGMVAMAMGQTELPTKPNPTVPLWMAETLGFMPAECAMIGDSEVDIRTARNAGFLAVGCSWGYRERQLLEDAGAHVILDHPYELTELFLENR